MAADIQERIGRNEATFRSINEDIERGRDADDDRTLVGFVCECGSADCSRSDRADPGRVRARSASDPCRFAIVNGHEIVEVENSRRATRSVRRSA